jgi:CDP-6-deoxy-D-xylo-4-hexulose-3-dehydrase
MSEVMEFARSQNWIVIEDTCESLGSKYNGKTLGCIGDMGTYSFYFSHHMTTGEGGMVTCQTLEDYDLLKCLRAHGWTRELSNRAAVEAAHSEVDPRFMFVNAGFNFRPMEIQAALGIKQLAKLPAMNQARIDNRNALIEALRAHPKWKNQFEFPEEPKGASAVWFGFPVLFQDTSIDLRSYLEKLSTAGVENRPVVSGNFARQPGLALFDAATDWKSLKGAERIHQHGFFVGIHSRPLTKAEVSGLADKLFDACD